MLDHPDPGGIDVDAVPLAAVDDLGIAGDDRHSALLRGGVHRLHDLPERLHRQALFQDKSGAEVAWPGPAHRQIIDGTVHRQRADITPGEE